MMNDVTKHIIIPLIIIILLTVVITIIVWSSPSFQERIKLIEDCENACLDEGYINSGIINDRCTCDLTRKVKVIK